MKLILNELNEAVFFVWELSDLQPPAFVWFVNVQNYLYVRSTCWSSVTSSRAWKSSIGPTLLRPSKCCRSALVLISLTRKHRTDSLNKNHIQSTKWHFYDRLAALVLLSSVLTALFLSSSRPFVLNIDCFPWLFFFLSFSEDIHIWQPQEREKASKEMAFQELQQRCQNDAAGIQRGHSYTQVCVWVCARVLLLCRRYPAASTLLVSMPRTPTSPPPRSPMTRSSLRPCTLALTWPSCWRTSVASPRTVRYFDRTGDTEPTHDRKIRICLKISV